MLREAAVRLEAQNESVKGAGKVGVSTLVPDPLTTYTFSFLVPEVRVMGKITKDYGRENGEQVVDMGVIPERHRHRLIGSWWKKV